MPRKPIKIPIIAILLIYILKKIYIIKGITKESMLNSNELSIRSTQILERKYV